MPRLPNNRPTFIYWLYDTRPETINSGWPDGKPFYCGKTVQDIHIRFLGHRADAKRHHRKVGAMFSECGEYVNIRLIETVPVGINWAPREVFWIAWLRVLNPDCTNLSDGGFGATGFIPSDETRRKRSVALCGKKRTAEQIEQARIRQTGKTLGPEGRRKVSEFNKGKIVSEATRQKMRINALGRKITAETRAKMSAARKGKSMPPHSEETKRKIGNAHRGRVHSPDFGQRISARQKGRKHTPEHCARIAEAHRGQKRSAEARRCMSEAMYASYERRKAIENANPE